MKLVPPDTHKTEERCSGRDGRPGLARCQHLRTVLAGLLLALCLVLVCLPRFNLRASLAFGGSLGDAEQYVSYVEFFRHQGASTSLRAPFTYRPLAPFVASLLPLDPMTSLNIVNLLALLLALAVLDRILVRSLACSQGERVAGACLFIFSFPTFYYGTIGYVDPVGLAFVVAGTHLVLEKRWAASALALMLGTVAKETSVVLLPAAGAGLFLDRGPRRHRIAWAIAFIACYLAVTAAVRRLTPGHHDYVWVCSLNIAVKNLGRARAWVSSALGFGLPGLLSAIGLLVRPRVAPRKLPAVLVPLLAGLCAALAVFCWSVLSAYVDGRFMWLTYPFSIPIAVYGWRLRRHPAGSGTEAALGRAMTQSSVQSQSQESSRKMVGFQ